MTGELIKDDTFVSDVEYDETDGRYIFYVDKGRWSCPGWRAAHEARERVIENLRCPAKVKFNIHPKSEEY